MRKHFINIIISLILLFIYQSSLYAGEKKIDFTSSNLPIIIINTNGLSIPYDNPRIVADMGIIYNGQGERNNISDSLNNYSGKISIEIRGASSSGWSKKSYGLETQNDDGSNNNVSLLGMPEENDWILYASYYDRSFLRNVLTFKLANEMGWYASRTRYCELVLNGEYQGIYVLMEKIKRDKNRVNISKLNPDEISGDDVTGGYIIKVDKEGWKPGIDSEYPPFPGASQTIRYQFHYPKADEIVQEQVTYISNFIGTFEYIMANENFADNISGYPKYLNVESFADYYILNEFSKNVDGYRLSAYLYKDKDSDGGKLTAGPVWDHNFSFGNIGYYNGQYFSGWQLDYFLEDEGFKSNDGFQVPFWWRKLIHDSSFVQLIIDRWFNYREDILNIDNLNNYIDAVADTLGEAKDRNFEIWIGPGDQKLPEDGWFPPSDHISYFQSYYDEIEYLKDWTADRITWIDENIEILLSVTAPDDNTIYSFKLGQNIPNPVNSETIIPYELSRAVYVSINIYNLLGEKVVTLANCVQEKGEHFVTWRPQGLPNGIYLYEIRAGDFRDVKKLLLQK
ncbi:MAG: CotH kinase family protein [Bacteroidales bacterium]|nr:CotH kinase family protein [Bacteroidales bacterium]